MSKLIESKKKKKETTLGIMISIRSIEKENSKRISKEWAWTF